jgi:hypothetical protein
MAGAFCFWGGFRAQSSLPGEEKDETQRTQRAEDGDRREGTIRSHRLATAGWLSSELPSFLRAGRDDNE